MRQIKVNAHCCMRDENKEWLKLARAKLQMEPVIPGEALPISSDGGSDTDWVCEPLSSMPSGTLFSA